MYKQRTLGWLEYLKRLLSNHPAIFPFSHEWMTHWSWFRARLVRAPKETASINLIVSLLLTCAVFNPISHPLLPLGNIDMTAQVGTH